MKNIEETKREVIDKIKKTGEAVIWSGNMNEYLNMAGGDDEGMPEDTPVTVVVFYEDDHYAMRVRYDPDTENEVSYGLGEETNVDQGFWMIVNSYMNGSE